MQHLENIIQNKLLEINILKKSQKSYYESELLNNKCSGFLSALRNTKNNNPIVAEIKRYSPSKGELDSSIDVANLAKIYEDSGATCISVLTDKKFFRGSNDDLKIVKKSTSLPILRKDFIVDEIQIYESKIIGADCILLILSCLKESEFLRLLEVSKRLEIDVLVEVHDKRELDIALRANCDLIGINNRNLKTFEVSTQTSIDLIEQIDVTDKFIISESGISNVDDINKLKGHGINGFLIGESLIISTDISSHLRNLVG